MVRTRLSSSAGQVAAEYVGGLLLVAVVIGALLGGQVHTKIAVEANPRHVPTASSTERAR